MTSRRKRVLSGMQPSGLMHLGITSAHFRTGSTFKPNMVLFLRRRLACALSTNYADTSRIREFVRELLIDWLAAESIPTGRSSSFSRVCRNTPFCTSCYR